MKFSYFYFCMYLPNATPLASHVHIFSMVRGCYIYEDIWQWPGCQLLYWLLEHVHKSPHVETKLNYYARLLNQKHSWCAWSVWIEPGLVNHFQPIPLRKPVRTDLLLCDRLAAVLLCDRPVLCDRLLLCDRPAALLASFPGLHAQLLSLAVRKAGRGRLGTRLLLCCSVIEAEGCHLDGNLQLKPAPAAKLWYKQD